MEYCLSIVLPVYNAEATLETTVADVLEVAAELTARFEMVVIDDGSTDNSAEIAHDQVRRYRQVRLVRHAVRRGQAEIFDAALRHSEGDIICIHEGEGWVNASDIRKLWRLRDDADLLVAREGRHASSSRRWVERLMGSHAATTGRSGGSGFQMLRREAIGAIYDDRPLLAHRDEIRLRRDAARPAETLGLSRRSRIGDRLREFTLGE